MSEDTQGVQNQTTTSPVEQNMVPKERLDELIAQRNAMLQQNEVLQEILRKAVPTQQAAPVQESEDMLRLKEENPALYQRFKHQEAEQRRAKATMFQLMEDNDRRALVDEFGEEGRKYLPQVEAKLNELRQQGIHTYNRGQIFYHLKGQEAVHSSRASKTAAPQMQQTYQQPQVQANVPSTNPMSASTTAGGSAVPAGKTASLEELEERLKDVLL